MQFVATDSAARLAALRRCPYLRTLRDAILEELCPHTSLLQYGRGEVVFWQEDECPGLFLIQQGSVKLFKISPQGRELIVRVLYEGAAFNEVPVFDGGVNPINVGCLEETQLWLVKPDAIRQAMRRYPEMAAELIRHLSLHLRQLIATVEELSFYQVTSRLARLLNSLPEEQLSGETRLTQDQLAALLGTVREVVARSLRDLERSGAIHLERRQILIADHAILQQWAQETRV